MKKYLTQRTLFILCMTIGLNLGMTAAFSEGASPQVRWWFGAVGSIFVSIAAAILVIEKEK